MIVLSSPYVQWLQDYSHVNIHSLSFYGNYSPVVNIEKEMQIFTFAYSGVIYGDNSSVIAVMSDDNRTISPYLARSRIQTHRFTIHTNIVIRNLINQATFTLHLLLLDFRAGMSRIKDVRSCWLLTVHR